MSENEKTEIKYRERHTFWTGQILTQFGFSINFFFVAGIGFLAYLVKQRNLYPSFSISEQSEFDLGLAFYLLISAAVLFSVFLGSMAVLSRLFDIRLTRHSIWIRIKNLDKNGTRLGEDYIDLSCVTLKKKIRNFFSSVLATDYFITDNDISSEEVLLEKFRLLRLRVLLLGKFSWYCHKRQVLFLTSAVMLYAVYLLIWPQ